MKLPLNALEQTLKVTMALHVKRISLQINSCLQSTVYIYTL